MPLNVNNTAVTTAGNATLSAAALLGAYITRSGPTGGFTDTTDTAANILAALKMGVAPPSGVSWVTEYINSVAQTCTFTGGTGVTINGGASASIAGNTVTKILFVTSSSTVAATVLWSMTQP